MIYWHSVNCHRYTHYTATLNTHKMTITTRFSRILIANRGEIAVRVMRTARRMGIESVAVYSDADERAQHVQYSDLAYRIGPAPALKSYLCGETIVECAKRAGAQAIHPGYGFLSENADFAELCYNNNIKFIGPSAQAIRDMGAKNRAKEIMMNAGVPTLTGYNGRQQDEHHLLNEAIKIGFPLMIKPVCGGGGKGMRICRSESDFSSALSSAKSESLKSFGNADMILERFVERPRHVEVQVFGDQHNNYVHLWERDCSVQRRHQKILEEAPAPGISQSLRERLGQTAVEAAKAVGYEGAGTVEFIMDEQGEFHFMEMNTRLQVEHPVTEAITGVDLVEWQLKVAQGEPLPCKDQQLLPLMGHAIEARLYAESIDPDTRDFLPSAGRLEYLRFPSQVEMARVDSGVRESDFVSVHYDPMIAKVIAHGRDRQEAINRLSKALAQTEIGGLANNVAYVQACLSNEEFLEGGVCTDFIERNKEELYQKATTTTTTGTRGDVMDAVAEAAMAEILLKKSIYGSDDYDYSPFGQKDFFRLNHNAKRHIQLNDATNVEVEIKPDNQYSISVVNGGSEVLEVKTSEVIYSESDISHCPVVEFSLELNGEKKWRVKAVQLRESIMLFGGVNSIARQLVIPSAAALTDSSAFGAGGGGGVDGCVDARAPIPGVVEKIFVEAGQQVKKGQSLATMTAMKMEFLIKAISDGQVSAVNCEVGQTLGKGAILVKFEEK